MTEPNRHIQAVPEEAVEPPAVQWETPRENRNTQWDDLRIEHEVELEQAAEEETILVDTGSMFVRVPKERP